jgi:hypothetical protein
MAKPISCTPLDTEPDTSGPSRKKNPKPDHEPKKTIAMRMRWFLARSGMVAIASRKISAANLKMTLIIETLDVVRTVAASAVSEAQSERGRETASERMETIDHNAPLRSTPSRRRLNARELR